MGTYYTKNASKQDIIAECVKSWESDEYKAECLKNCVRGGECLWSVWTYRHKVTGVTETIIKLDLLQPSGYGWGYKPMDESCHPYYYSCPLEYLDMAPAVNEEWRAKVRAHHAQRSLQLA